MNNKLSFRTNFSYSFIGNMVYSGCLWLMLSTMTKLLPVETVGRFVLAVAIVTPIQLFLNLQLRSVQGSDAKSSFEFGHYFALRIISVILLCVTTITIGFILNRGREMFWILATVAFYKSIDSCSDIVYGLLIKNEQLDKVAISRICRGTIGTLIFFIVLILTRDIIAGLTATVLAWFAIFSIMDLKNVTAFTNPKPIFNFNKIKGLIFLSIPLGLTMSITSFNSGIPRYLTESMLGTKQLGYFGALAYIIAVLRVGIAAVGSASLARLSQYYISNHNAFVKLLSKMILFALTLALAGVLIGELFGTFFLSLAYSSDYANYKPLLLWLLAAGGVGYISTMLCVGLTAARLFKPQVPMFIAVSVITLITCRIFISNFGIAGGAMGMLTGSMASCFIAIGVLYANIKKNFKSKLDS